MLAFRWFGHEYELMKLAIIVGYSILLQGFALAAVTLDVEGEDPLILADPVMKGLEKPKEGSPVEAAFQAFQAGDYEDAVALAEPLAATGDENAIYLLGFAHETGQGAKKSREMAIQYYEKGVVSGHAESLYRLSFLLMGSEKEEDAMKAQKLLEKAAEKDPKVAGRILGEAFLRGAFTQNPSPESAVKWWKKASDSGDIPSMNYLARFYEGQLGFPEKRDTTQALDFYTKAAEEGDTTAMVNLASRLLNGEEKLRNEKKGREWITKAIEAGEPAAYFALGNFLEQVKKDPKAALAEYEKGVDAGQVDSMLRAAALLINGGKGFDKNVVRVTALLKQAAEAGSAQAHLELAGLELNKDKPDVLAGYTHLLTAASGGLPFAQNEIGIFYLSGKLGVSDVSAAVSWFGRAAQANFAPAQNNLAALHERGTGVPQSYENAIQLYTLAAQQGHPGATLALARFQAAGAGTKQNMELAWALGKIAEERGEIKAADLISQLEEMLTTEQLASAKKELEKIRSGNKAE